MSEVARLRQEIETAREAAIQGLTGLAQVGRHRFLTKRMEQQADTFETLVNQVGKEEACKQLFGPLPEGEQQKDCQAP